MLTRLTSAACNSNPFSRGAALQASLPDVAANLDGRDADNVGDGVIADMLALGWLEWCSERLRLTVIGTDICESAAHEDEADLECMTVAARVTNGAAEAGYREARRIAELLPTGCEARLQANRYAANFLVASDAMRQQLNELRVHLPSPG